MQGSTKNVNNNSLQHNYVKFKNEGDSKQYTQMSTEMESDSIEKRVVTSPGKSKNNTTHILTHEFQSNFTAAE